MKSILEEFACGNVTLEPRFFKRDSRYGRAVKTLTVCEEQLFAVLNEADKEILKRFSDAQSEINNRSGIDRFVDGYRLGVLMTVEVFNGESDLIAGREDC